ncbi:MAG: hypothetical protein FJ405_09340 [Verrucomicrobia bacterium]|nr:hypothetical protein [Verrucomicrobiota bacterium]
MKDHSTKLRRLIELARRAPTDDLAKDSVAAPYGFASRVAAGWCRAPQARVADLWERFCWWGAAVSASVCLLVSVAQPTSAEGDAFELLFHAHAQSQQLF